MGLWRGALSSDSSLIPGKTISQTLSSLTEFVSSIAHIRILPSRKEGNCRKVAKQGARVERGDSYNSAYFTDETPSERRYNFPHDASRALPIDPVRHFHLIHRTS